MDFKLVGSILMIVGTSIGAGMLALPIATAQLGFVGSLFLLLACWFVMTISAFLILEVNLWLPLESNLISMAKKTLGPVGQLIAWVTYLLLLNSLLCAYISGGSDLLHNLLALQHIGVSSTASSIFFTLIFSVVVYLGIRCVDYTNRVLMCIKLSAYFTVVILLFSHLKIDYLKVSDYTQITSITAIMVSIVSFGYATLIPSLRVYFNGDVVALRKAIIIGSLIPLICYIFWDLIMMGTIPLHGPQSLLSIAKANGSTSMLVNTLRAAVPTNQIKIAIQIFTSVCVLTSFLGVALCLTDFLADGFQLEKKGLPHLFLHALTFLPPLLIVLYNPLIFTKALTYAGLYCVVLIILLPAWMAWRGRYYKKMPSTFRVVGGKPLLLLLFAFGFYLIIRTFI